MVNTEEFIKRLEQVLDFYSLTASTFADKIGVQRSSLSHLLSGRNKPSLDFVMKVVEVFDEVDLYWLLNGSGNFPKLYQVSTPIPSIPKEESKNISEVVDLFSSEKTIENTSEKTVDLLTNKLLVENEIEQIVLFYKNGSFKVYKPN